MSMQWYAVHTFTGQENNIKKRLEQMIEREGVQDKFGRILVPIREVVSNVRGKRRVSVQKLLKWSWTSSPSTWCPPSMVSPISAE